VDEYGRLSSEAVTEVVTGETALVAVMRANNETGNLYDIRSISLAVKSVNSDTLVLVDAVQAAGKLPVDLHDCGGDLVAVSAHKMYGPKGVGALLVRRGSLDVEPVCRGGGQEKGLRGGTENVAGIVGFGAACELDFQSHQVRQRTAALFDAIQAQVPDVIVLGDKTARLPGTLCLRFDGIDAESLLIELDLNGVAASSGSACATGTRDPSHVLLAMHMTPEQASQTVRLCPGRKTTVEQVESAARIVADVVKDLRK